MSARPSAPNYETYLDALTWYGDPSTCPAGRCRCLAAWGLARLGAGDDPRPDSHENGFDVYAPCAWVPNTVAGARRLPTPPHTDPCLDQGGLDLNIYGAWVGAPGRHPW